MKKVSILFAFLAIAVLGYSQSEGKYAIEINLNNPFVNANFFSSNGINARYFISDNVAARAALNISGTTTTTKNYSGDDLVSTTKTNAENPFSLSLTPGIEYHIAKFNKGSVYVGGELGVTFISAKESIDYAEYNYLDAVSKSSGFGFGIGAFTGIDYYLTNNLYLGAELGLNYALVSIARGSTTTGDDDPVQGSTATSISNLGITMNPALRLGWRF